MLASTQVRAVLEAEDIRIVMPEIELLQSSEGTACFGSSYLYVIKIHPKPTHRVRVVEGLAPWRAR